MNLPLKNPRPQGPVDDRLVDRLVDGELADVERRQLLVRLENEPGGWRHCALAFLEAQNWRQALAPLAPPIVAAAPPALPEGLVRKRNAWPPLARLAGLAAGLVVAFALGWSFRRGPQETVPGSQVSQELASVRGVTPKLSEPTQAGLVRRDLRPPTQAGPADPLAPLVKLWQQRGYRAERQERLVSFPLKDGRKLNLPVQEIRLHYIGARTY